MLTSYANTAELMPKQRITTIIGWEGTTNMLEKWLVSLDVILGPEDHHPNV